MMRRIQLFNHDWRFTPNEVSFDELDDQFESVTLPHTNKLFTGRYVNNLDYQFVSTYRKRFPRPELAAGERVFIDFDGVMLQSTVYLNGQLLGKYQGGYTPFSFDITDHLLPDENVLTVYVNSTEDKAVPPYGGRVDFLTFGGIYRDMYSRIVDACHITNVFAKPLNVLSSPALECDVTLSHWEAGLSLEVQLIDQAGGVVASLTQTIGSDQITFTLNDLNGIQLWELDDPTLYHLELTLCRDDQPIDQDKARVGFRSAEFSEDGHFYLNGEPLKLFGLNRHQTYPYIGAAAPARLQELDADILKYELGCNIVRTSHYVQSPHFINRCDEIGLLVFEEIPGWQHIGGDKAWQEIVLRDVRTMIERDRNHPSIILWGVRVNESPDCDHLYTQTNVLAHQLDPTRQTGGVRNFIDSHKLEDVFTLNDFPAGLQNPIHRPHLITEFAGHMFPTKTWDHEERRVEHALHHARKHNLQMGYEDVAGAIGWCAFDYHTHQEFGSGDRICHHGVMDMYRLPKMAAYFYRSQKSPQDEVVLYSATNWTMGDRSGGGNQPLVVFSNCDEIEVLVDDASHGRFQPDRLTYPYLPHPPFTVRWAEPYNPWGMGLGDLMVKGFINGEQVAVHQIAADHVPHQLILSSHTTTLKADGIDMARVALQIVDRFGNTLPYQQSIAQLSLEGHAEIVGENPLVLLGGQAACFVKSSRISGEIIICATVAGLPSASLILRLED